MQRIDITRGDLYISKLLQVIRSHNNNLKKEIKVKNRAHDALIYITSGVCRYVFEGEREVTVRAGDVLYLARHANYTIYVEEPHYRFVFCDFDFDSDLPRECDVFSFSAPLRAEQLFDKLFNVYQKAGHAFGAEAMAILYTIYALVIESSTNREESPTARMGEARLYIDTNYKNVNLSVSYLAEYLGISETHFRNLFKKAFGEAPSQYIISRRLQAAKELLRHVFLPLEDVAVQCGFSSCHYFIRTFKKHMGTTPAQYRKRG